MTVLSPTPVVDVDIIDPKSEAYGALDPEPDEGLTSPALGLGLVPEGQMPRLFDSRTGQPILTGREKSEGLEAEEEKRVAQEERRRADELAAEVERLRNLLNQRDAIGKG